MAGRGAGARLLEREVADAAQHVVQRVDRVRARALGGALEVGLDLLERVRVDQLAQLLLAEQLAQQLAVERQRGGAALGVGRVALVHVGRDVVEQQRGGERRGGRRLDLDQARARASAACAAGPAGRARRARRAGTRGRSRARSGTARSAWRPRAASATSAAAATAACGGRGRRAGSAARGRRSRGSARRTARSRRARRRPCPRARRGRSARSPRPGGSSASGRWTMIPSSDQIASDSRPYSSRMRALSASPQAACTRPPNGERMHTRQSPISSRKRSTTIVRSLGMTRVASCCSRRKASRFWAARWSRS